MGFAMRVKLLVVIAGVIGMIVGLTIGFVYFTFYSPAEFPDIEVMAKLDKTKYQVGEKIYLKPYVINKGNRPIKVLAHGELLFRKVYDVNNREVSSLTGRFDVMVPHTLRPHKPYNESQPPYCWPALLEVFAFTLDQPGRYKIVVWAELFFVDKYYTYLKPMHTYYAKPIWIEVVAGSN